MLINPSSQLIIDGECKKGCYKNDVLTYEYRIYNGTFSWYSIIWQRFPDPLNLLPSNKLI